jgi:hypothetical protein
MPTFETDEHGNVILKPVTGYTTSPVAGVAVALAILYVETPEELERDDSKQIQFVLTPQQALAIAEALTRQAKRLMEALPPSATRQ